MKRILRMRCQQVANNLPDRAAKSIAGDNDGLILAMAAAGEVAPLMLVGVKKVALDLPFDTSFPTFIPNVNS